MHLLYISKSKIEVFKNKIKIGEVSWTKDTFVEVFGRLKSTFSSKFRILLSDEYINITSFLISKKESRKRKNIYSKAQLIIPNLNQTTWDYKIVANLGKSKLVQIIYLDKDFFDQLRVAVYSSKIKVKLLESFSTSICQFIPKNKLVFLLFQNLIIISFNQTPIFSKILDNKLTQEDIDAVFSYTNDRFKTLPQQIIFSPTGDTAFSSYDFGDLSPEYLDINPISGLINSPNVTGPDESTSRLEVKPPASIATNGSAIAKKISIVLFVCILIILGLIISGKKIFFNDHNPSTSPVNEITPTQILTPTPTVSLDLLKIQVLNGTGVAGQASKVSTLLSQNNFKVEKTGNASNYDFVKTEVQIKDTISKPVIDLVIESLQKEYDPVVIDEKLNQTNEFDIVIVTGKERQ